MNQVKVIAIDQGTTSTKALLVDQFGKIELTFQKPHLQITPRAGWVEHDPEEIYTNILLALESAGSVDAIGLSHQGETIVAWDAITKKPLYNMIVWQDQRTEDRVMKLKEKGYESIILEKTGLPLDSYFPASKFAWLLKNIDAVKQAYQEKHLRIGTSESFFLDRLTGIYGTDYNSASRTSLFNAKTLQWDEELCNIFSVPIELLPPIRNNIGFFGYHTLEGKKVPITAVMVDQFASAYGHGCRKSGDAKVTFGTGAFLQTIVGNNLVVDPSKKLSSALFWKFEGEKPVYGLDAGVYNVGSAINWAKNIRLFDRYEEINTFEKKRAIERDIVFIPALSGLACPYWDRTASGMWSGLSLETTREDMMQSILEGIAFRTANNLDAMESFTTLENNISIDGGLVSNPYFIQFLADILGKKISIPNNHELTGLGIGLLALKGLGVEESSSMVLAGKLTEPKNIDRKALIAQYESILQKSRRTRSYSS